MEVSQTPLDRTIYQHQSGVSSTSPNECSSLLTLVDIALALDSQENDHTYAISEENIPKLTDSECLLQKEKDHNYAYSSKQYRIKTGPVSRTEPTMASKRSSSEENLVRLAGDVGTPCSSGSTIDDSVIGGRKFHSGGRMSSNSHDSTRTKILTDTKFASPLKRSGSSSMSSYSENARNDGPYERRTQSLSCSPSTCLSSSCDHTYAMEDSDIDNSIISCDEFARVSVSGGRNFGSNPELTDKNGQPIHSTVPLSLDHTYDRQVKLGDHNYVNVLKVKRGNMSVRSQSAGDIGDTVFASWPQEHPSDPVARWMQLQNDHSYSTFS